MIFGTLSMGLIIFWINFFPCFGPALSSLKLPTVYCPHIFIAAHGVGLYAGAYFYYALADSNVVKVAARAFAVVAAALSLLIYIRQESGGLDVITIYALMSLLSGIIVSRWMTWFSSGKNAGRRGKILGLTICLTYILLSINTYILAHFDNGLVAAMAISSGAFLAGGWLCASLPVPVRERRAIPIKELFPPADLLLLGLLAYGAVSLFYNSIFISQAAYPLLPWLLIIPYLLVSLILARLSDRYDRYFLAVTGFFFCGTGFLIYAAGLAGFGAVIVVNMLMSAGLLCIHYFYWLSLVDRQNSSYQPFMFITGILFELIVVALGIAIVPLLLTGPELRIELIGISGVILVLIGIAVSFSHIYSLYHQLKNHAKTEAQKNSYTSLETGEGNSFNKQSPNSGLGVIDKNVLSTALTNHFNFTKRETEVAMLLFNGLKNNQITETIYISPNTVKFHIKNILSKTGAANRNEALKIVLEAIESTKKNIGTCVGKE